MLTLNAEQLKYLQRKLAGINEEHAVAVEKIAEAAKTPGALSSKLGWITSSLMYNDLLRLMLQEMLDFTTDEKCSANLASMKEWYTREIMRWEPQHSTNPTSNLEEEMRHKAHLRMLEDIQNMEHRGDK